MNTKLNKLIIFFGIVLAVSLASNAYAGWGKNSADWDNSGPGLQQELAKSEKYNAPSNVSHDSRSKGIFTSSTRSMELANTGDFDHDSIIRKSVASRNQNVSEMDLNKKQDRNLSSKGSKGVFTGRESQCAAC